MIKAKPSTAAQQRESADDRWLLENIEPLLAKGVEIQGRPEEHYHIRLLLPGNLIRELKRTVGPLPWRGPLATYAMAHAMLVLGTFLERTATRAMDADWLLVRCLATDTATVQAREPLENRQTKAAAIRFVLFNARFARLTFLKPNPVAS